MIHTFADKGQLSNRSGFLSVITHANITSDIWNNYEQKSRIGS